MNRQTTKNPPSGKPTPAELQVLKIVWGLGSATARQVHEAMQAEREDITYSYVLRQLQIMHQKGILLRDESQRSHVYQAREEKDSMQTNLLSDFIQRAFSGSAKALILAALKGHVSQADKEEIQKLLNEDKHDS